MKNIMVVSILTVLVLTLISAGKRPTVENKDAAGPNAARVQPEDFQYLGAFRLPGGNVRPKTFAYGGNAMTFNPDGDAKGPQDGFPGSLFVMGHDRLAYGDLPDGGQVAEISIPVPVVSRKPSQLKRANFLQGFRNVAVGYFTEMEEIQRAGMQYLNTTATGPKIHLGWGQHFEPDPPVPTHAWFSPNLNVPDFQGTWFIARESFYAVNDYMLEVPPNWANKYANGRYIGTGRYRSGGWSGMGPALFAYRPWINSQGTPAAPGTRLPVTVLLRYEDSLGTSQIRNCLKDYQHPDEWEGTAWITTTTGKSALLFAGNKSTGAKYWYGYVNPAGPQYPCVDQEFVGQFDVCRLANGAPCPPEDLTECSGHNDYRGWWTSRFDAQFILYDETDITSVATRKMKPWKPQPYATVDIDDRLFLNPSRVERDMLGEGVQRRYRIGTAAYDRAHDLLYVLEWYADGTKPVIHVWRVR